MKSTAGTSRILCTNAWCKYDSELHKQVCNVIVASSEKNADPGSSDARVLQSCRHDEDKRAKPTPKTAPPSEPPTQRGRSASRKKNLRGPSPSGKFARQLCGDYLKGFWIKSPCDYWHPPECLSLNRTGMQIR